MFWLIGSAAALRQQRSGHTAGAAAAVAAGHQVTLQTTCFTSTTVQILTPEELATSLFSPEKRAEGELGDVRARVDKCEEAQAATYERLEKVEERLGALPSEADFKYVP